ncbi:MAG TPA: type II secretion system F family protein [Steroidobacteraceae bacterium]|nr:type II secretion system F family protein [Steroidobacteraceae bacterium]HQX78173.1 type II secretion system F family protein [Steroidobacteraceae bacterium]HQZ80850.1 type II secretion system F family protein [Steroidobacteraceae bacterium]
MPVLILGMCVLATMAAVFGATGFTQSAARTFRREAIDAPAGKLADLFIFVEPERLLRAGGVAAAVAFAIVLSLTGLPLAALGAASAVFASPRLLQATWRKRYQQQIGAQLPDAMAMLAGAVRAGSGLAQGLDQIAVRVAPPLGHELALVMRRHRLGVQLDEALRDMGRRVPLPEVHLLVTAVALALQVGGSLGGTLDRLADTLRRKHVIEAKLRALTSQGRLQAIIVTALPVALMLALTALDPVSMRPLVTTAGGWAVLGCIAILETTGWLLIRRIVAIDV